uniref:Glutamate--cysteine ligase n=1 Tax=Blastobotrys adeninivorans TaxID=409370 RepID=A0A060T4F1_BLAAD
MGLLSLGTPMKWEEAKKYADHVRDHGIEQLIHTYNKTKDRKCHTLLWGDEVESMVVEIDPETRQCRLSLRQAQILDQLAEAEKSGSLTAHNVSFHPEYGRYMIETTPAKPFTGEFSELLKVEDNMKARRDIARKNMNDNEVPLTITCYPMLGVGQFCDPYTAPGRSNPASRSFFLPDEMINTHVRFPTLTANIRSRRGSKVAINVPIYKDKNTPSPFIDPTIPWERDIYPEDANARDGAAKQDHIYMDSMGFGMGCCCLQITFQATDISEARNLYDQLAPLTPIFLALTAASPAYRGYLADQDARWNVIAGSVDDRTPVERGLEEDPSYNGPNSSPHIPKSRYDSIDCYISNTNPTLNGNVDHYNDSKLVVHEKIKSRLLEAGFDQLLATHFAHLFIRDPIVIFKELLHQNDEEDSDHFENIQSTNWQTLRFKPPPPGSSIGWRVEFRPMEIQLTDFENAAFSIMIVLLTRVIISYKLNFYLPISMVDENMKKAHGRDAVGQAKFWFRTNVSDHDTGKGEYAQLTVDEIINGCDRFVGLIPLVKNYLQTMNVDLEILCKLDRYLTLVSKRASGRLCTTANWIRNFVRNHPQYKFDSQITHDINYDLINAMKELTTKATPESESLLAGLHVASE